MSERIIRLGGEIDSNNLTGGANAAPPNMGEEIMGDRLRKRIKTDYVLHFMTLLALAVMLTIVGVLSFKVLEQGFDIVRDFEDYVLITIIFVCSALAIWNAYFPIDGVDRS